MKTHWASEVKEPNKILHVINIWSDPAGDPVGDIMKTVPMLGGLPVKVSLRPEARRWVMIFMRCIDLPVNMRNLELYGIPIVIAGDDEINPKNVDIGIVHGENNWVQLRGLN